MTILVTGATGKTGALVVAELARRGVPFRAGTRRPGAAPPHAVRFDWEEPSTWAAAVEDVDTVYLVKPPVDPVPRVAGLLHVAFSLRRVVLLSELGREEKPAGDPERDVERILEASGLGLTILRPSWFLQNFGPEGGWGADLRSTGTVRLPSAGAAVSWVDMRDVVDVAVAALLGDDLGGVDITGVEPLTVAELVARMGAASGRALRHDDPDLASYRLELEQAGLDPLRIAYLMDLLEDVAAGGYARTSDDLARVLGQTPRPVNDYLAESAGYWRGDAA